jgi:hypothetical protein
MEAGTLLPAGGLAPSQGEVMAPQQPLHSLASQFEASGQPLQPATHRGAGAFYGPKWEGRGSAWQSAGPPGVGLPPPAGADARGVNPSGRLPQSKASDDERQPLTRSKAPPRQNLLTFLSIFFPPAVYTLVYYTYSFTFRDRFDQYLPYIVQWTCYAIALAIYLYALTVKTNVNRVWLYFLAGAVLFMTLCGGVYGDENYGRMRYYYAFQSMAAYVNINPSLDSGLSYGDAGEVYFKEGSRVDTTRAVAFKNSDIFCAAPVILELESGETVEAKSMDWWAVGVNCCKPNGAAFTCGQSTNYLARSGMRLLEPYDLPYYQFAVHQFSKKYDIPVKNPLFFNYVVDPLAENGMLYLKAHQKYYQYVTEFFILNLVAVIIFRFALDWSSKHA